MVFTSMCVTALLLGRRSSDAMGRILAGLIAAVCMLPCRMVLPQLYKSANAPPADAKSTAAALPRPRPGVGGSSPVHTGRSAPFVRGGTVVLKSSTWRGVVTECLHCVDVGVCA